MKLRSHDVGTPVSARPPARQEALSTDPVAASLIETGLLSTEHLDRVNDYCKRTGASFADAVVDLGLISPEETSRAMIAHAPSSLIDPETSGVSRALVAAYDPADQLVVKLRALRSVLFNADDLGRGPARILVLAGAGTDDTTGVAANLAVLVAQLGARGLLVDANFAAPAQHALFGIETNTGVTSLLVGQAQSGAVVQETPIANLDLLAAGPEVVALSELVERVSLIALLRTLPRQYAFVIVDVGEQPAEMIAALARGSDGVVMVVERDHTPLSALQSLLGALERNDVSVIGSVLAR